MKICHIDLNSEDFFEDYSYSECNKYGGGRIISAAFLNKYNDFHIYANPKSFLNVRPEKQGQCHSLPWESRNAIKNGELVSKYIPEIGTYDIVYITSTSIHPNVSDTKCKVVCWSPGKWEGINPLNKHLLLFSPQYQCPRFQSDNHVIHKIVIGPQVDDYKEYPKEDMIFQCSRQGHTYNSEFVAALSLKYGVKCILAGPVENNGFLKYIDNKTTFYLGEIDTVTKIDFYKKARLVTQLQNHIDMVSLSAKEGLSYGCGILALPRGEWKDELMHGVNAFFVDSEESFVYAINNMKSINQKSCWSVANRHSEDKMVDLCLRAFENIVKD